MSDKAVIVATDLSSEGAFAARWAKDYAALSGAQVVVAHVVEIKLSNWANDAYQVLEDDAEMARLRGEVSDWYQQHTGETPGHIEVVVGDFEPSVTELVQRYDAQMIAITKSDKSAIARFFEGSHAQMLALKPPCPVALIDAEHATLHANTQVAVAVDLMEKTSHTIAAGHALLSLTGGATMHIAHATNLDDSEIIGMVIREQSTRQELIAKAEQALKAQASSSSAPGVTIHPHIYDASPVDGLAELVETHQVDVLVLGVAKESSAMSSALGKLSVKLSQRLPCTVLLVPARA